MKRTLLALLLCSGWCPADPASPRLVLPVPHTQPISVLRESPDGHYLASGDTSGVIKVWDESSQKLQQTLASQRGGFLPLWLDWLAGDKLVCYGNDFRFHTYDVNTGLQIQTRPEQPFRCRGGFAQAGGKVYVSPFQAKTPSLQQWDPINWTMTGSWELPAEMASLSLTPKGERATLIFNDGRAMEMSLPDGKATWQLAKIPEGLSLRGYGPDGQSVLASDSKGLYLLGASGLRGPFSHPPDRDALWVDNHVQYVWDKKVVDWDPAQPDNPGTLSTRPAPDYFAEGVANHRLTLGAMEGKLLDALTGEPSMARAPFSQIRHVAYDSRGRIYAGLLDGGVLCWNLRSGVRETVLQSKGRVTGLAVSADGKSLVVCRDGGLDFYDGEQLKLKKSLPLEGGPMLHPQCSQDGRYLVGVRDGQVELYDTQSDRLLRRRGASSGYALAGLGAPKFAECEQGDVLETDLISGKKTTFPNYNPSALAYDDAGHLFGLSTLQPGRLRFEPVVKRTIQEMLHAPVGARDYNYSYRGGLRLHYEAGSKKWVIAGDEGQVLQLAEAVAPVRMLPDNSNWNPNALSFLPNGSLVTVGREHTVEFWKPGQAAPEGQVVVLNEGADWLVTDQSGLFDGTPEAEHQIEWLVDNRKLRVDQFFERGYRPGLLKSFGAGGSGQVARPVAGLQIVPPQVEFRGPTPGAEISQRIVEVRIAVKDLGGGAGQPLLFVNGKAIPQSGRREGDDFLLQAPLQPGVNELRCTAMDGSGTVESRGDKLRVTCTAVQARAPKMMVIAVGLNQAGSATRLNFAEKDAQSLSERLQSPLFSSCDVRLLAGDKARTDLIGQAFQEFAKDAQAQDTLVLFLAGHGTLDSKGYHFLMSPGQPSLDGQTLAQWLREFPAQKQFVILDTCHAGAVSDEMAASFAVNQQRLARGSGVYMLAACRSEQSALELPSLQHGLLTYSLLEGLKSAPPNSRQQVTVSGLVYFVCSQVPDLCRQVGLNQDVFQFVSGTDFPIRLSGK